MDGVEAGQLLTAKLAEYRKLSYAEDRRRRLSRGDRGGPALNIRSRFSSCGW